RRSPCGSLRQDNDYESSADSSCTGRPCQSIRGRRDCEACAPSGVGAGVVGKITRIPKIPLLRIPLSYVPRAAQKVSKAEWRTGGKALTKDALLLRYRVLSSRIAAFFSQNDKLHHARFANPHELTSLLSPTVDGTHLLLGES